MSTHKDNPSRGVWRWKAACAFLFALVVALGAYAAYHHQFDDIFVNAYPLIDPARSFIPQEDFIVNVQPLREKLRALVAQAELEGLQVSLYFEYLNTGANISINPDLRVWPASLPKVPMAMLVMKKIESGVWSMEQEMTLEEADTEDKRFGTLWQNPLGTKFSIEEMLSEMLTKSDNTPYRMFLRNMEQSELLGIVEEIGLQDMFGAEGRISAKEYSRIFRSLYTSSFLRRESSQRILTWLSQSTHKDYLAAPLPAGVSFAHKFGIQIEHNAHLDSGIAYVPGRPYIITVAVQGTGAEGEQKNIERLMHNVASETYSYINNRQ